MHRVIGMLSPSWSGSTLWNLILDGLPGVAGVGEDHWIVDGRKYERPYYCTECRDDPCPVFTAQLLRKMRNDLPGWWGHLAAATGCDTIVTSDKGPHHYERFGAPDVALVPYKDLRAHVTSYVINWERRNKSIWDKSGTLLEDVQPTDDEVARGIPWVVQNYQWVLDWAATRGLPVVPLHLDVLTGHPYRTLRELCDQLHLQLDFGALAFWSRPHHHIGGNFSVRIHHGEDYPTKGVERSYAHQWQDLFKQRIAPDDKWRRVLRPDQAERIITDDRVRALMDRLQGE